MTSVPKPLKFLRPHFEALKAAYDGYPSGESKAQLADIISLLAMTMRSRSDDVPESLKYRLLGVGEARAPLLGALIGASLRALKARGWGFLGLGLERAVPRFFGSSCSSILRHQSLLVCGLSPL